MLLLLFGALAALRTAEGQSTFELTPAADGAVGVSGEGAGVAGALSADGQGVHGVAGTVDASLSLTATAQGAHGTSAIGDSAVSLPGAGTAALGVKGQGGSTFAVSAQGTAVFTPEPVVGAGASSVSVSSAGSAHHTRLPVVGSGEAQIDSPVGSATGVHAIGAAGSVTLGVTVYARATAVLRGGRGVQGRDNAPVAASRRAEPSAARRGAMAVANPRPALQAASKR